MCLERVFSDEEMAEHLEGQPEVIEVKKLVIVIAGRFAPFIAPGCYKAGINVARRVIIELQCRYYSGFHFYPKNKIDTHWRSPTHTLACLIKKEWITAIGLQNDYIVIVASQAIFPHYPETEARREDLPKEEIAQTEKQELMAAAEKCTKFRDPDKGLP